MPTTLILVLDDEGDPPSLAQAVTSALAGQFSVESCDPMPDVGEASPPAPADAEPSQPPVTTPSYG